MFKEIQEKGLAYDPLVGILFDYCISHNKWATFSHWTYICKKCIRKFRPPKKRLEEVEKVGAMGAHAPCGCEDCSGDGRFFYDFNAIEDPFTIVVKMAAEGEIGI